MHRLWLTVAASAWLVWTPITTYGWNRTGHRATAIIAYRQLDEATRKKVVAILEKNPVAHDHWRERKINSETDVDAFMNASTFPDDVRPPSRFSKEFHRSTHHYVNLRYAPNEPNQSNVEPPAGEENILSKYRANLAIVKSRDPGVSDAARAVALSWIFHQEGDIHMPLHAVSRYSNTFPEGDRGGNLVEPFPNPRGTRPYSKNLHAYWDDLLGDDDRVTTFDKLEEVVEVLVTEFPRSQFTDAELKESDIKAWALESAAAAKATVYRGLNPDVKSYKALPVDYELDAQKLGRRRIALAGYRLAEVLKDLFGDATASGSQP